MPNRKRSVPRRTRRARRTLAVSLLGGTIALLLGSQPAADGAEITPGNAAPFTSVAAEGTNVAPFRKWQSMLNRYEMEKREAATHRCRVGEFASTVCLYQQWGRFLDGLRDKDRRQQLRAVNDRVNKQPYVNDAATWGVEDYWETPGEFLAHGGDCEDYAILKFLSLRQLGWTGESLRIAAVHDTRLNVGHAVVVVENDGKTWILDSQVPEVVEAAALPHYQPVYSLTETSWRLHRSLEQESLPVARRGADGRSPAALR